MAPGHRTAPGARLRAAPTHRTNLVLRASARCALATSGRRRLRDAPVFPGAAGHHVGLGHHVGSASVALVRTFAAANPVYAASAAGAFLTTALVSLTHSLWCLQGTMWALLLRHVPV